MKSEAKSPEEYLKSLPADRQEAMSELRKTILKNLPKGFSETIAYGMLGYVVPHSIYPAGYHCDPKQALPFMGIASQKGFIAFYHMGMYGDKKLSEWFTKEYPKHCKSKLDMGKSCVRFKKVDDIPYRLIGELVKKVSVKNWISAYEKAYKK